MTGSSTAQAASTTGRAATVWQNVSVAKEDSKSCPRLPMKAHRTWGRTIGQRRDPSSLARWWSVVGKLLIAERSDAIRWAIVPDDLGTSVGSFGFDNFDEPNLTVGLGGAIARIHWGPGFASLACAAIIEYAFDVLEIERIQAETLTVNPAVVRVSSKVTHPHTKTEQ